MEPGLLAGTTSEPLFRDSHTPPVHMFPFGRGKAALRLNREARGQNLSHGKGKFNVKVKTMPWDWETFML